MNYVLKLLKQKRKELQDDLKICFPCLSVGAGKKPKCIKYWKPLHSIKISKSSYPARIADCKKMEDSNVRNKIRQLDNAIKLLGRGTKVVKRRVSFEGQL